MGEVGEQSRGNAFDDERWRHPQLLEGNPTFSTSGNFWKNSTADVERRKGEESFSFLLKRLP